LVHMGATWQKRLNDLLLLVMQAVTTWYCLICSPVPQQKLSEKET